MIDIITLKETHWEAVRTIFVEGILTNNATFTSLSEVPSWNDWSKNHLIHSRFVAVYNDKVVGWSALTPYSEKYSYRGVAEVSVYVALEEKDKGIGKKILQKLVATSEENGIWTLHARVYPENEASIHIHKQLDFFDIGTMKKAGKIDEIWRDVIILERRSKKVGN